MGGWCSGNTSVFGTAVGGSIPSLPDDIKKYEMLNLQSQYFFYLKISSKVPVWIPNFATLQLLSSMAWMAWVFGEKLGHWASLQGGRDMKSTTLLSLSIRIISRGIKVFLIQKLQKSALSKTKSIPWSSGRDSRNISQSSLFSGVSAISSWKQWFW